MNKRAIQFVQISYCNLQLDPEGMTSILKPMIFNVILIATHNAIAYVNYSKMSMVSENYMETEETK